MATRLFRTVYACEWCRSAVTTGIESSPSIGFCTSCVQTVTLIERREPCNRMGRLTQDAEILGILAAVFVLPLALCALLVALMLRWGFEWSQIAAFGVGVLLFAVLDAYRGSIRDSAVRVLRRGGSTIV